MSHSWLVSCIQAVEGCSPLPCLQWEQFSGLSLERTMCCWDYLEGIYYWTQLMPLYKLFRFWKEDVVMCLYCSHPSQPMYINRLPCSLNLPATDLEESAFLSGLFLPSVYDVQVEPTIIHSISSSFFKKNQVCWMFIYITWWLLEPVCILESHDHILCCSFFHVLSYSIHLLYPPLCWILFLTFFLLYMWEYGI